jgi:hypothetical protein
MLLGFIGLGARAHREPFFFPGFSPREEAIVGEYVELMRSSDRLPMSIRNLNDRKTIREAGAIWARKELDGKLANIPVVGSTDSDGSIKEQIMIAQRDLVWLLMKSASIEQSEGHYDQSADDLAMATIVSQVGKTSDLSTVSQSCRRQCILYSQILSLVPQISEKTKAKLARSIAMMRQKDVATIDYIRGFGTSSQIDPNQCISDDYRSPSAFRDRAYIRAWQSVQLLISARTDLIVAIHAKAQPLPSLEANWPVAGRRTAAKRLAAINRGSQQL